MVWHRPRRRRKSVFPSKSEIANLWKKRDEPSQQVYLAIQANGGRWANVPHGESEWFRKHVQAIYTDKGKHALDHFSQSLAFLEQYHENLRTTPYGLGAFISFEKLSKAMGVVSKNTIYKRLKVLKEAGLIQYRSGGNHCPLFFQLDYLSDTRGSTIEHGSCTSSGSTNEHKHCTSETPEPPKLPMQKNQAVSTNTEPMPYQAVSTNSELNKPINPSKPYSREREIEFNSLEDNSAINNSDSLCPKCSVRVGEIFFEGLCVECDNQRNQAMKESGSTEVIR